MMYDSNDTAGEQFADSSAKHFGNGSDGSRNGYLKGNASEKMELSRNTPNLISGSYLDSNNDEVVS